MSKIEAVCWDVDRVWYDGISTSYCIDQRQGSPAETMRRYMKERLFTERHVQEWREGLGKDRGDPFESYPAAGAMLTDFLYRMKTRRMPESMREEPVLSRQETIMTKQGLLRGMSLSEIRRIALGVYDNSNPGLQEAIDGFRRAGIYQVAFSDGLSAFILYHTMWRGMEHVGVPTAIVEYDAIDDDSGQVIVEADLNASVSRELLAPYHPGNICSDIRLTGKVKPSDKAAEFREYMERMDIPLRSVAIIDDSGVNVKSMLVPVRDAGGIAVGFRPTDVHRETFDENGIPVITNLYEFAETVKTFDK